MSVVTISRASYSRGREIAERVARNLGFECISGEILKEASREFMSQNCNSCEPSATPLRWWIG